MADVRASNAAYPSLQGIMDLCRALLNQTTTGTGANTQSWVLPFLNSAIQDTFSDLRVVGAPRLIRDNVILSSLPLRNPPNATGSQQFLSFTGFFDGVQMHPNLLLPADMMNPERIWQRQSGTGYEFIPLSERESLNSKPYSYGLGHWEWRDDKIWFSGSTTTAFDMRLRYTATYPEFLGSSLDFTTTFVPILGSLNAVAAKMCTNYAFRLAPEQYALAKGVEQEMITKLKQEIVLQSQNQHQRR